MTISKTPRKDYPRAEPRKFAPRPAVYVQHLNSDAFPDSALQEAARIQRAMSTDMPPMPELVERETWSDWWADVRGWVLCGMFVGTVLAFVTHVAGVWGA